MDKEQRKRISIAGACFTYQNEYERVNSKLLKELFDIALSYEAGQPHKLILKALEDGLDWGFETGGVTTSSQEASFIKQWKEENLLK